MNTEQPHAHLALSTAQARNGATPAQFDLTAATSSLDALQGICRESAEAMHNIYVLRAMVIDADYTINQPARTLRSEVEPPTLFGEPVSPKPPTAKRVDRCHAPLMGACKWSDCADAEGLCTYVAQEAGPRYFCNKCGYGGPVQTGHQRPNGTGKCGYMAAMLKESA